MTSKSFQRLYPFILKVDNFEGFSNQNKIDKIVNNHLCSYHSKFKKSMHASIPKFKDCLKIFSHAYETNH